MGVHRREAIRLQPDESPDHESQDQAQRDCKNPARDRYKQQAILHAGNALRRLISREFVETRATFVPIACSKALGDPDHDDRLSRVLQHAFHDWSADIREMLTLTQSTPADHESADRLTFDALLGITRLSNSNTVAPRPVFILIDDVLNSGKHFKVAQSLLTTQYPNAEIRGLFLARCIRESPDFYLPPPPTA